MSEINTIEVRLPVLFPDSETKAGRSEPRWVVGPGQEFAKGQVLGYVRAYHPDLRARWWDSRSDMQVLINAPESGRIVSVPEELGGWNSLAQGPDWNESRNLGAMYARSDTSKPAPETARCTAIYGDRFHPMIEPRSGGILNSSLRRLDVWSQAPEEPKVEFLAIGQCDLVCLVGGVNGDYERWTDSYSPPSMTTILSDVMITYSSHFIVEELRATEDERSDAIAEVSDLILSYLELAGREADSDSVIFLSMVRKYMESPALSDVIERTKVNESTDVQRFAILGQNVDSVMHLRSKKTKLIISMPLWRCGSFDKTLTKLLRKRFTWEQPNPDLTMQNVQQVIRKLGEVGYKTLIALQPVGDARHVKYTKAGLQFDPHFWMRQTNIGLRKMAEREGAGVVDFGQIVRKYGTANLTDDGVPHFDQKIQGEMRGVIARALVPLGLPESYLTDLAHQ